MQSLPVVSGSVGDLTVNFLFDTGAPMCNLDLSLTGETTDKKVSKEVVLARNTLPLQWRVKDLTVIKQSLNCAGVIGNNFLENYAVYFDTKNKVIRLY